MVLVAGIAVHVMPCHDCGIIETLVYSLSRCFITMHVKQFFACMFYNAVFFLYLWPEIKSYYYFIIIISINIQRLKFVCFT